MEKTAEFFGVSVSTVHRYCEGIVIPAEVREQSNANEGQFPRIASEVVARRPTIFTEPAREEDDQRQYSTEPNGFARTDLLDENDPEWRRAKSLLVADALAVDATGPLDYVKRWAIPDIRAYREMSPWLPGATREQKMTNFRRSMIYARRYLELRKQLAADGKVTTEESEDESNFDN
jgi:bifunctional DNA-binding transcriptional regulator/antitoxin component of YhaV-PrlF toxin-antitoxin module